MRSAHFIEEDTRGFDAPFFSMTPQEAASLDPQQRGILEMTYKALENGTTLHVLQLQRFLLI